MKTLLHCFWITVLFSGTLNPIGFDDLFSGDGDPFADFDFGSMDTMFNDMSFDDQSDPFSSLFNQSTDQDSFSSSSPYSGESASSQKKEVTPPVAESLEEAFTKSIDGKVTKLTPQYKKAMRQYLASVITQLQILLSNCSSFSLGIKLTTDLAPTANLISQALELVTKLQQNSVYHILFLSKEFSSAREKLVKAPADLISLNKKFDTLPSDTTTLTQTPSSSIKNNQKKIFKETESISNKLLNPLITDLKKLFAHKQAAAAITTKQKKHAAVIRGSQANASGGWNSSAPTYFDDNFGLYGGGNSSWSESGNDFWDSFGGNNSMGGYDWGNDFGGGYSNSYNNWSSDTSWSPSRSSATSPQSSTSSSRTSSTRVGSEQSSFNDDDFAFDTGSKKEAHLGGYTPPAESDIADLEPEDQIKKLIPLLTSHITKWETNPNKNDIKKLLETPSFGADIERLTRLFMLLAQNKDTLSSKTLTQYMDFKKTLEKSITVCVDAVTYASPPFAALFEEHAHLTSKKISLQDVRNALAKAKRQRDYAYQKLLQLLGVIRAQEPESKLYSIILEKLQRHAYITLKQLSDSLEHNKKTEILSLEQLMQLTALSRKLFHEPVAIGYAVNVQPQNTDEESKSEKPQQILAALLAKKEEIAEIMRPIIDKHYTIFHTAILILQDAVAATKQDMKLAEDEEFIPRDINAIQALATKVDRILSTEPYASHQYNNEIRTLLLPYDQQNYQHIEVEHALLDELKQFWLSENPDFTTTDTSDEDSETLTATEIDPAETESFLPAEHSDLDL
jgi:hypothetical protein